jgi:hypothetical protein
MTVSRETRFVVTWSSSAAARSVLAIVCLTAAIGCPIPARHTELVTPQVTGIVRDSDGTSAAGIPVAVSPSDGDLACMTPSARGVTDSAGRFQLPAVHEEKRVFWFTPLEHFGTTSYRFCVGGAPTTTTQQVAAMASTRMMGWARGDTLECFHWTLRDSARVSCNRPMIQYAEFTFGAWRDARDSGYYRLLRADEDTRGYAQRAVVQWLAVTRPNASGGPSVLAQLELPTGEAIVGATYAIRRGRVVARVESIRRTKWDNRRWLAFELGGPGEAREVPDH